MRGHYLCAVAAFAAPMLASPANAQPPVGSIDHSQLAYVTVRGLGEQNLRFEIYAHSDDGTSVNAAPSAVCREPCQVKLSAGSYLLKVAGPVDGDVRAGAIPIEIAQDSEVLVKTASQGGRSLGRKVGIVGSVVGGVAATALFVIAVESMGTCGDDDCVSQRKTFVLWEAISLGALAAGATAALLGWLAFGRNNASSATVVPIQERTHRPRLSEIGFLRTETAWGLSATAVY